MGNCSSGNMGQVQTAKLILEDGQLREFPNPVKVSYLLQKYPMCFICNSDEMDFDDFMMAIDEDEVLQPGQLYFALPLSRLNHPLRADEMAALAVKASSALMKSGCCEKYISRRTQIVVAGDESSKSCRTVSHSHRVSGARGVGRSKIGRRSGGSGDRWAKSTTTLGTIPE
ncbi:uncharacterized protein LOC129311999 [Prosopis cineraria]|uniref:uncharacterized protein LOC129311999 n=1 Tax=Prosopis cineraria TaxID=364024 RepID=UPI00241012A2|nr:uncharacterized protein LOC129311999 [Prosopis cineraria]